MVHLHETAGTDVQALFNRLMASTKKSPIEKQLVLSELLLNLGNSGSLIYCNNKIDQFIEHAKASLDQLKDTIYKTYLIEMADSLRLE
jgi:hypothetical protein